MKAKEIILEAINNKEMIHDPINKEWWIESLEHRIKVYALQKCKEQREIIARDEVVDDAYYHNYIINAPEPEFE